MSQIHVDLLTAAKQKIQSGERTFICDALWDALWQNGRMTESSDFAYGQIKKYIREALGDYYTACEWLYNTVQPEEHISDWVDNNYNAIQEWRCLWIDQMIEIFKDVPDNNNNNNLELFYRKSVDYFKNLFSKFKTNIQFATDVIAVFFKKG